MLWDDVTTPWDRLMILQSKTSWAIYAKADWPDGSSVGEAICNVTLESVIDAIRQREPYVGRVDWCLPRTWKESE